MFRILIRIASMRNKKQENKKISLNICFLELSEEIPRAIYSQLSLAEKNVKMAICSQTYYKYVLDEGALEII